MSDYFYCLAALVWRTLGHKMPIRIAEWVAQYQDENNA